MRNIGGRTYVSQIKGPGFATKRKRTKEASPKRLSGLCKGLRCFPVVLPVSTRGDGPLHPL